jgi:hypothetical protein
MTPSLPIGSRPPRDSQLLLNKSPPSPPPSLAKLPDGAHNPRCRPNSSSGVHRTTGKPHQRHFGASQANRTFQGPSFLPASTQPGKGLRGAPDRVCPQASAHPPCSRAVSLLRCRRRGGRETAFIKLREWTRLVPPLRQPNRGSRLVVALPPAQKEPGTSQRYPDGDWTCASSSGPSPPWGWRAMREQ